MPGNEIDAASAAVFLRAVSNPARLRIVLCLLNGEKSVTELENELALKQPNLSQHLAELRNANLVATRREVKSVFYSLSDGPARHLVSSLLQGFGGRPLEEGSPVPPILNNRHAQAANFAKIASPLKVKGHR
jgi:DNA-binding transcriptional ArsR family regulator